MNIQDLKDRGLIIFEAIVGSQAYGTATETSDVDTRGVFIAPLENVMGYDYVDQVSDEKNDHVFYELKKFLEMIENNNPNILELLNTPEECIIIKHEIFDFILEHRDKFITKKCKKSFGEYANTQISKARGLNKMIVQPEIEKKDILDFCFVVKGHGSYPFKDFIRKTGTDQKDYGLVRIPNAHDLYAVFYCKDGLYRGVINEDGTSNEVRLSSVPKGEEPVAIISYNKDEYTKHCKAFKRQKDWETNRNPHRFADNMLHGKGYDGKNLAHCHRLLDMAIEIGKGKGIIVRRDNRDKLLAIRRGEYEYDDLISEAENKIEEMNSVFEFSSLPEEVDSSLIKNLLIDIREKWYKIQIRETISQVA